MKVWLLVCRLGAIIYLSGQNLSCMCASRGVLCLLACCSSSAAALASLRPLLFQPGGPFGTTAFLPPTASAGLGGCCCGAVVLWWRASCYLHTSRTLYYYSCTASAPCGLSSLLPAAGCMVGTLPAAATTNYHHCHSSARAADTGRLSHTLPEAQSLGWWSLGDLSRAVLVVRCRRCCCGGEEQAIAGSHATALRG